MIKILSLNINSKITTWCLLENSKLKSVGSINTNFKTDWAVRLSEFRGRFASLLLDKYPTYVVIKNDNLQTQFIAVAMESCVTVLKLSPSIINYNTLKNYFKIKNKKQLIDIMSDCFDLSRINISLKKQNDIFIVIAQGIYYYDIKFDKNIRQETSYGYLFKIKERRNLKENDKKRNKTKCN